MSRILDKKIKIDSNSVKEFYNLRAQEFQDEDGFAVTMFQSKENAANRDKIEKELLLSLLPMTPSSKVLDIACGVGRLVDFFYDKVGSYLGIDYSDALIRLAKNRSLSINTKFQVMSAANIEVEKLEVAPPFNIILITAALYQMNDDDVVAVIGAVNKLCDYNSSSVIYIREPISMTDSRLTLKDFYSNELRQLYNAIYRTDQQLKEMFSALEGFSIKKEGFVYDGKLHNREETKHKYYLLENRIL